MLKRIYQKKHREEIFGRMATVVSGLGEYDLSDTMECGQCFRHVRLVGRGDSVYTEAAAAKARLSGEEMCGMLTGEYENYVEYLTVVFDKLVFVGQRRRGELIFYDLQDGELDESIAEYFSLDKDFDAIRQRIKASTKSDFMRECADAARGVVLLTQPAWETVFSFIISQNNNIPRIRKIIRYICSAYGENLAEKRGLTRCPISGEPLCVEVCRSCGICYSFPTPKQIYEAPELMLAAKPGFRYKYLLDAAGRVLSGEVDLDKILSAGSYEYTLTELKKILGVGDKVASCAALFAFGNYEAFPIDVWIKRAIDEYFDGKLDIAALGEYAGVAQQYIFHTVRNLTVDKK